MRILTFAAYPMLPDLMVGSAGERLAAIAFLQVRSCYSAAVIKWLADRVSPNEEHLVQYHAAGALLHTCRRADKAALKSLDQAVTQAKAVCEKVDKSRISERALELLDWSKYSLDGKPFSLVNVPQKPESPSA